MKRDEKFEIKVRILWNEAKGAEHIRKRILWWFSCRSQSHVRIHLIVWLCDFNDVCECSNDEFRFWFWNWINKNFRSWNSGWFETWCSGGGGGAWYGGGGAWCGSCGRTWCCNGGTWFDSGFWSNARKESLQFAVADGFHLTWLNSFHLTWLNGFDVGTWWNKWILTWCDLFHLNLFHVTDEVVSLTRTHRSYLVVAWAGSTVCSYWTTSDGSSHWSTVHGWWDGAWCSTWSNHTWSTVDLQGCLTNATSVDVIIFVWEAASSSQSNKESQKENKLHHRVCCRDTSDIEQCSPCTLRW